MSKESDDEYFFLLRQEGGNLEGTVSRAGVFAIRGSTLKVQALWCYRGKHELHHRIVSKLLPEQISYIDIVLEETAWEKTEKVG